MLVGNYHVMPNEGVNVENSGELILVATPIGNLSDASLRMIETLKEADVVYCEDTRHSRTLLRAHQISAAGRLESLHEHNEVALCDVVIERVRRGERVALITDAGTPGVSDPGYKVTAAVAAAGLRVTTIPGPSAVIAALSVSGLPTDRFVMEGFIPRKASERDELWARLTLEPRTIIMFESPQRIGSSLISMAQAWGDRRVVVARELTKMHEEVVRGTVSELARRFSEQDTRGEIVVVLEGAADRPAADDETLRSALRDELGSGRSLRDAARSVAELYEVANRRAYDLALEIRSSKDV